MLPLSLPAPARLRTQSVHVPCVSSRARRWWGARLCGGRGGGATGALGCALLETVGELAWDELEGSHAAGSGRLSPLGLLAPVVCAGGTCVLVGSAWAACCGRGGNGGFRARHLETSVSRGGRGWVGVRRRTLSNAGAGVSAVGAGVLLDVHGTAACERMGRTSAKLRRCPHFPPSPSGGQFCCHCHSLPSSFPSFSSRGTYRSVCTGRATCCGAFRSWTFPSLCDRVSGCRMVRGDDGVDAYSFWLWSKVVSIGGCRCQVSLKSRGFPSSKRRFEN
jgi:hypothetical protein